MEIMVTRLAKESIKNQIQGTVGVRIYISGRG